jgi:hypothetical protein
VHLQRRALAVTVLRCLTRPEARTLSAGGCIFVEDATCPAECAHLLWSADLDRGVLVARALPTDGSNPDRFDLAAVGPRVAVAKGSGGEHVVIADRDVRLRLDIVSGTVLAGPVLLDHQLIGAAALTPKLRALEQLVALCRTSHAARWREPPDPRLPRLVAALRVIDALAEDASLREIAIGLRLNRAGDWPGTGESVKSHVRRLVALARALRKAGPCAVLRRTI